MGDFDGTDVVLAEGDYERALREAPPDHRGMVIVAASAFFWRRADGEGYM